MQYQWREEMLDEEKWSIIQEQLHQLLGKTPSVSTSVDESAPLWRHTRAMPPKVTTKQVRPKGNDHSQSTTQSQVCTT